jgi:Protein of unknown function (DUF1566)
MHRNSNPELSTLRPLMAALVLSFTLVACGGGGTTSVTRTPTSTGASTTDAVIPVITSIAPTSAQAGVPTQFTVAGTNIPLTSVVALTGGTCFSPTNATLLGFLVTCTPGITLGAVAVVINNNTSANGGWWIGQQTLTITASTTTPTSPSVLGQLTDTGITANQCYGAGSDALISCTSASAIALNPQQDGMIGRDVLTPDGTDGWLGSSYSLSTSIITTVTPTSTSTTISVDPKCLKDNVTGLTWQRGSTTLTTSSQIGRRVDGESYRDAANTAVLCGFSDWRLPTPTEVLSLVNYGLSAASPAIDMTWFPATKSNFYLADNAPLDGVQNTSWVVDFVNGSVFSILRADNSPAELRLVR